MSCCFGAPKRSRRESRTDQSKAPPFEKEKETARQSRKLGSSSRVNNRESREVDRDILEGEDMRKSKLLEKIDVMDFKLDDPEGISNTPYINTFRYESILSHNILSLPRKPQSQTNP